MALLSSKPIKPTIRGFLKWAKLQPAAHDWNYGDPTQCPFACYLRSLGVADPRVGHSFWGSSKTNVDEPVWATNRIPPTLAHLLFMGHSSLIWAQPALVKAVSSLVKSKK